MATTPKTPASGDEDIFIENYKKFQERRASFENIDNEINASAARIMKAMADVAEKQPEAFFGLKPTEKEVFVLNKIFDPEVLRSVGGDAASVSAAQDIIGGQGTQTSSEKGGFLSGLLDGLLKRVDIGKYIVELIQEEKKYWFGQSKEDSDKAKQEKDKKSTTTHGN